MTDNYGVEPGKWYSPNEIVDQGLLFGKSKRYVFDLIQAGKLKAVNTSDTRKPQWKIQGKDLIEFIKEMTHENSNVAG
jgi:hypothetical protein